MQGEAGSLPLFDNQPKLRSDTAETDEAPTVRMAVPPHTPAGAGPSATPPAPLRSGKLVRCAWPVLSLLGRIVSGADALGPLRLKDGATSLLQGFERTALADGVNARDVAAARYVLCTALDEAVLTASWGPASGWNDASLLSRFYNETWGGEKVFTLIDRALQNRKQYLDLLELCHFVLLLGFQGKYRLERDGTAKVDVIRRRLYDVLQPHFGAPAPIPVPIAASVTASARLTKYVPVWSVAAVCLLAAAMLFGWMDYRLRMSSALVAEVIDSATAAIEMPRSASSAAALNSAGTTDASFLT